jgi:hypothetical protein
MAASNTTTKRRRTDDILALPFTLQTQDTLRLQRCLDAHLVLPLPIDEMTSATDRIAIEMVGLRTSRGLKHPVEQRDAEGTVSGHSPDSRELATATRKGGWSHQGQVAGSMPETADIVEERPARMR